MSARNVLAMVSRSSGETPADDAKSMKSDLARGHSKDISRMRVSMKEAILKNCLK